MSSTTRAGINKIEEKLIHLVKERPLIYQKSHPDHRDANQKDNAWKKIFELLGKSDLIKSESDCEKIWRSLWRQFLSHQQKVKGKTGKEGGARPYFRHEMAMLSFRESRHEESTSCNDLSDVEDCDTGTVQIGSLIANDGTTISIELESEGDTLESISKASQQNEEVSTQLNTPAGSSKLSTSKAKKRKDFDLEEELIDVLKSNTASDEHEAFARGIAIKLRKLHPRKASELTFRLQEAIYNYESLYLE